MKIFHLPDLGEGLAEAEIREWYVQEGDTVKIEQPLLSVETAKAVVDVPSPYAGRITKLHGKVHEVIKTHAALVEFDGDKVKDKGSIVGQLEESQNPLQEEVVIGAQATGKRFNIKPTVKALAKQLQVDLSQITPSGIHGEITATDVKRHAEQVNSSRKLPQGEALHGVRRAMATAMSQAHREIAQITIMDDVDISHLAVNADLTVILLKAIAAAIKVEPSLNAWFDGHALERQLLTEVNIGIAMDTAEGLFVPVIKNVDQLTPEELRQQINHLKERVKKRGVTQAEMQGATIILSNFGTIAGKYASPMVMPPIVAILGSGRVHNAPVVRNGEIIIGRVLPLSLSADHRAITGAEAARFLATIKEYLQQV